MKLLFLGAPGAGKGTMAALLSEKLGIPHISTGEMLRQEIQSGSELGLKVKAVIERGDLVNDDLMMAIIEHRLQKPDCVKGYILDGLPRTLPQAKALAEHNLLFDAVIVLDVDDSLVVSRLTGRRVHPASGRTYHIETNPPKTAGLDDETGEPLIQRKDDEAETVKKRLAVYHELTAPLLDYYKEVAIHVDGARQIDVVLQDILERLP